MMERTRPVQQDQCQPVGKAADANAVQEADGVQEADRVQQDQCQPVGKAADANAVQVADVVQEANGVQQDQCQSVGKAVDYNAAEPLLRQQHNKLCANFAGIWESEEESKESCSGW